RVVDDARELLISPEYVDDVHPTGNLLQPAIDLLSEDRFFARVDGDHVVSAVEQIPTDAVGIAMRLGREPDDGDPAGRLPQPADRRVVRVRERHPTGRRSPC